MAHVLKIGGSLLNYPDELRDLCRRVADMAGEFDLLIVPGGGVFADAVREVYSRLRLPEETSHQMAVLAMDQYGLLLQSFLKGSSRLIYDIGDAGECFEDGQIALLLASRMMLDDRSLPKSWSVTSDSIAAYVAGQIGAETLVLVKAVDGLTERRSGHFLSRVSVGSLDSDVEQGCIDGYISNLLKSSRIRCYIVNGTLPDRVEDILRGKKAVCTEVVYG
ncbi:MAG: hypothetical protein ACE5KU_04245 [Nitrososphaerales archaeon]